MIPTLAERLRARTRQLHMGGNDLAEAAGVNRSFVYDIMRGKSERPNLSKLEAVAAVLKVDVDWLLFGRGHIEGNEPMILPRANGMVAIPYVDVRPSMGGGAAIEFEPEDQRVYHFPVTWVREAMRAAPQDLRMMHVAGDSMEPTLCDGDLVMVDMSRKAPTPPGIFVLNDGVGLVAKRLEHIPQTDPLRVRILSDNPRYSPYESTAEEVTIVGRVRWFGREIG